MCNEDFTNRNDEGGLLFGSYGCCPTCAKRIEEDAIVYGEQHYIKERANPGESFRAFTLRLRGGNNTVHVRPFP